MIVQIYGFTTPADIVAVQELAIDNIGVVLDEGFGTWDGVDEPTARAIVAEIPATMATVALSLGTDFDRIARTVDLLQSDIVHLVRADQMGPEAVGAVRDRLAPVKVMTTVAVRDESAIQAALVYAGCSDFLLLDSHDPATGIVGATGLTHDWSVSALIPPAVDVPVILAGGLGPENIAGAIAAVDPAGVDSETRTSRRDDKRRKDVDAVRRFVEIARSMTETA
ncbi:MAG TPA: phosphoribosylanthranilate isomerase [Acidimicrobiales bacterium]|nr:phosphoribosylanthranilate isomerase [Acidimicrobiales bacterium]